MEFPKNTTLKNYDIVLLLKPCASENPTAYSAGQDLLEFQKLQTRCPYDATTADLLYGNVLENYYRSNSNW